MKGEKSHKTWLILDGNEVVRESDDYGIIVAAYRGRASPTARVIRGREVLVTMQPDRQWRKR